MNLFVITKQFKHIIAFSTIVIVISIFYAMLAPSKHIYLSSFKEYNMIQDSLDIRKVNISMSKISLNHSTVDELCIIPGVGEKTARKIVAYRKKRQFFSISDIMKIKGIGEKKFAKMKQYIIL